MNNFEPDFDEDNESDEYGDSRVEDGIVVSDKAVFIPIVPKDLKRDAPGRPTVMTPDVINKLEYVFSFGGTDKEACLYAGISHQTLYDYQNLHPEFVERKEALKENPVLLARQIVIQNLHIPKNARWYLERKKKDEFAQKIEQSHSGVIQHELKPEEKAAVDEVLGLNTEAIDVTHVEEITPQSEGDSTEREQGSTDLPV